MNPKTTYKAVAGFILLFIVYHVPEFFSAFWIAAVSKTGFLLLAFLIARWQGWKGLGGFGLSARRRTGLRLLLGFITGIAVFSAAFTGSILAGFERIESVQPASSILQQIPLLLLMTAIPSVAEDILTRGYVFAHKGYSFSKTAWIVFSASLFLLSHIWRLGDGPAVLAYLFLMGLLLALAVWITQSLWLAFGIHWGSNLAFELSRSAVKTQSLVTHNGSTWILALSWMIFFLLLYVLYPKPVSGNEEWPQPRIN